MKPALFVLLMVYGMGIPSSYQAHFLTVEGSKKAFKVIKVKGEVRNLSTGKTLTTNVRFSSEDTLKFSDETDRLALIDEQKRAYIARPKWSKRSYTLEPIRAKFGTRPGKILTYVEFVTYLEGRDFLILGDRAELEIEAKDLRLDQDHFFFIRYQLAGEKEPINKKLPFVGNKIVISRSDLFTVDGQPVPLEAASGFTLYYYNAREQTSLKVNNLNLVFPDEYVLKEEIEVIRSSYRSSDDDASLRKAIENYLLEVYGMPEEKNLNSWLNREYGL